MVTMDQGDGTNNLHWTDEPEPRRGRKPQRGLATPQPKGLTLAESKAAMLADVPGNPLVPPVTATVLITLFFGVFGVIPAAIHSDRARQLGSPTSKYWQAFAVVLAIELLLGLLIIL